MGQNVAQNSVVCPVVLGWDVLEWDRLQKWKFTMLGSFRPSQSEVCCEVGGGCDPWLHGTLSEVGRTAWTVSYFRPNPAVGRKRTTGKTDSPSHLDRHILAPLPCRHPHLELSSFHCLLLQLSWLLQKLCWSLGQPLPIPPPSPPLPNVLPCHPPPPTDFCSAGLTTLLLLLLWRLFCQIKPAVVHVSFSVRLEAAALAYHSLVAAAGCQRQLAGHPSLQRLSN